MEAVTLGDGIFVPNVDGRTVLLFDDGRRLLNGNPKDRPLAPGLHIIGPDYFRVHDARLVAGREFTTRDTFSALRVVVVNETMARMHWAGQTPIGRKVNFGRVRGRGASPDEPWADVIGVVADIRHGGVEMPPKPEIYRAALQYPRQEFELMIRTSKQPERVAAAAREQVGAFDADVPVFAMTVWTTSSPTRRRRRGTARGCCRCSRQSPPCSARSACSASSPMVFVPPARARHSHRARGGAPAHGARRRRRRRTPDAGGGRAGLIVALFATRVVAGMLYEVAPRDPGVMIGAAVFIAAAALLAAWVPARRAARTDPIAALKSD